MTTLNILMERNQTFVENGFDANLPMMPKLRVMIICCADPRVDPAHLLGLEAGEAAVIRNVGGRITPATLQNMALLQMVGQSKGGASSANFDLIVLHHTDCGITHLEDKPDMLASYFGVEKVKLPEKAIHNPYEAVAIDVAVLKENLLLPPTWSVSGMVYDVATGRIETVVAPLKQS
jgi:carbonic anhydrase